MRLPGPDKSLVVSKPAAVKKESKERKREQVPKKKRKKPGAATGMPQSA